MKKLSVVSNIKDKKDEQCGVRVNVVYPDYSKTFECFALDDEYLPNLLCLVYISAEFDSDGHNPKKLSDLPDEGRIETVLNMKDIVLYEVTKISKLQN